MQRDSWGLVTAKGQDALRHPPIWKREASSVIALSISNHPDRQGGGSRSSRSLSDVALAALGANGRE